MPNFLEAEPKEGQLLQLAIKYVITGAYLADSTKDKERAVCRKTGTLVIDKRKVFLQRHWRKVKVVVEKKEQA